MIAQQKVTRRRPTSAAPPSAFDPLVRALSNLDWAAADTVSVERLLGAAGIDDASLAPFVHFVPGRYTRNCVYRDERFELLVLCWPAGVASPVHDHGGSRGFVKVQSGSLTAENYTILEHGHEPGPARLALTDTLTVNAGGIVVVSAERDVHRVSASGGSAISLHVYARPLESFLIFDPARDSCRAAVPRDDIAPAG